MVWKKLSFFVVGYFVLISIVQGQNNDNLNIYPFILRDTPAKLFTMRQIDENYVSVYRLSSRYLYPNFGYTESYITQGIAFVLIFGPLTHEEAHRSILTSKNIGSVSQPFLWSKRGGYVDGVNDENLKSLRDNSFPDYIRLYTAGLESDYLLTNREEDLIAWQKEPYKNICIEYLLRKTFLMQYYLLGFFKYDVDGNEEANEYQRDIVGNDVYGTARHLHRPQMTFHRYTRYSDLTSEEKHFVHKMGYRSLFNLLNSNIIGIQNFRITNNLRFNAGMAHTLCPFGDFTDENLWISYLNKWNIKCYVREYENRSNWFMAGGISFDDYFVSPHLALSGSLHAWQQPLNMSFDTNIGKLGGATELNCRYFFFSKSSVSTLRGISFDISLSYKTTGYLPEEVELGRNFGIRFGTSFLFDN
jgi:hypothetical protein